MLTFLEEDFTKEVETICFASDEDQNIPKIYWEEKEDSLKLFLIAYVRPDLLKFFLDTIANHLLFCKRIQIIKFFHTAVKNTVGQERGYFAVEFRCTREDRERLQFLLPIFESSLLLGLQSSYLAKRVLELRGMGIEAKELWIQEYMSKLIRKFPLFFDYDIFSLVPRFLVTFSETWKQERGYLYLAKSISRIYATLSLIREADEDKRALFIKLMKTSIQTIVGVRPLLGIVFGFNTIKEGEFFEKQKFFQMLKKIKAWSLVESSYFSIKEEGATLVYLEIQKERGDDFDAKELSSCKTIIEEAIKSSIDLHRRAVFMPYNGEEVMKYIVTLSRQIKSVHDLPHIVIMFHEERGERLYFTLVIVRPLLPRTHTLEKVFAEGGELFHWQIEKIKQVGMIRKRFPKEASVLKVELSSKAFYRDDLSIDLYSARECIVGYMEEKLGPIRDYNGGLMSKEKEIFRVLQESLGKEKDDLSLQNFFYALRPLELRSILPVSFLKIFYSLFDSVKKEKSREILKREEKSEALFFCIKSFKEKNILPIQEKIRSLNIPSRELLELDLHVQDNYFFGGIYFSLEQEKRTLISQMISI